MKYFALTTATSLLLARGAQAQCPNLIWSDEFDGTKLDESKWSNMVGDGCDMGEGMCGWGNNEWQHYTAGDENLVISNGTMKIFAKFDPATNRYTSARIRGLGKADFDLANQNLRLEARMKVPKNSHGLWPAFWMMPSQMENGKWPLGGEIDIMEFIGREANHTYGVMHYGHKWNDKNQKGGLVKFPEHVGEDFHVFAVEKTKNQMAWYVDGRVFQKFTKEDIEPKFDWPFEGVFHFILNLAIGGSWAEYPDAGTQFPNVLEVDYVRVYDLDTSEEPTTPQIVGETLVRTQARGVQYCVSVGSLQPHTDYDSFLEWSVPSDADYMLPSTDSPNCIKVNFGTQSGYVQAKIHFTCGRHYEFKLPVEVQDYYGAEFSFLVPDETLDQAKFALSTGTYNVMDVKDDNTPATIVYQRNRLEVYDHIYFDTSAIPNPQLYVESAKKFYMDALSPTAAPCTRFFIQLEDSSVATPDNYPVGRHSRYVAYLEKDTDWQRLEFDYFDQPDQTTAKADRIVLLIDSFVERSDLYYLRNLDSASAGCTGDDSCELLATDKNCQAPAKSEAGACADGFNNDGFGWNGDGPTDCEDSDCWGLDPACTVGETLVPPSTVDLVELCYDGVDNTGNGKVDCEDEACADHVVCGSWSRPACNQYPACVKEGHAGDCCPNALGEYKDCCTNETPASCSVHPTCAVLGLEGNCCPGDDGNVLSCCTPDLCASNPRCSGLDGACCPNEEGVFLECCENKPQTCQTHPRCAEQGFQGECCPTPDGSFMDCCEPRACSLHPGCAGLTDECCPTPDGIYLDCCNLDLQVFDGFTGEVVQSTVFEATPFEGGSVSKKSASGQPETEKKAEVSSTTTAASEAESVSSATNSMGFVSSLFLENMVLFLGLW